MHHMAIFGKLWGGGCVTLREVEGKLHIDWKLSVRLNLLLTDRLIVDGMMVGEQHMTYFMLFGSLCFIPA
jgi:hypothetical protein